jgi:hypothetical protein
MENDPAIKWEMDLQEKQKEGTKNWHQQMLNNCLKI